MVEKGTQTKTSSKEFEVKITVKYQHQERTYIIRDKSKQKLVKLLINKGTESALCKHLSKSPKYRSAMKDCVIKDIKHELDQVVKNREDLLRTTSIISLLEFDWNCIIKSLDNKVPSLMSILRSVVIGKKKLYIPNLVMAASLLLYARNQTLNLVQLVLGLVLDSSGLNKESIYQLFYKETSAVDRGSLYQLRNLISRRDVTGPNDVTQKFRPHQHFIEDVTDAYILAAFWDKMDCENDSDLMSKLPVFSIMSDEQKTHWLNEVSSQILGMLNVTDIDNFEQIRSDLLVLSNDDSRLSAMKIDNSYLCPICGRSYSSLTWFKKHLKSKHNWKFHKCCENVDTTNAVKHFLFMSLIFRDTCDSYKLADGNRIIRNAFFEWLYASALKHTKYKIWLWRMITYVTSVLDAKQSFEYKWNMCVNLKGGIANNIPNDNAVEIQVCNIKRELNTQGANKSFQSARKICLTTQVIDSVKTQLMHSTRTAKSKRDRPPVDKAKDVNMMVQCLRNQGSISEFQWRSFSSFKDPIQCIVADDLHAWINNQKTIASVYL